LRNGVQEVWIVCPVTRSVCVSAQKAILRLFDEKDEELGRDVTSVLGCHVTELVGPQNTDPGETTA
jgi:hypothetical protein